jgi:hypothetical protein
MFNSSATDAVVATISRAVVSRVVVDRVIAGFIVSELFLFVLCIGLFIFILIYLKHFNTVET